MAHLNILTRQMNDTWVAFVKWCQLRGNSEGCTAKSRMDAPHAAPAAARCHQRLLPTSGDSVWMFIHVNTICDIRTWNHGRTFHVSSGSTRQQKIEEEHQAWELMPHTHHNTRAEIGLCWQPYRALFQNRDTPETIACIHSMHRADFKMYDVSGNIDCQTNL